MSSNFQDDINNIPLADDDPSGKRYMKTNFQILFFSFEFLGRHDVKRSGWSIAVKISCTVHCNH